MNIEAANDLVKALETMSLISKEQSRDLAQSRGEASHISEMFEKTLKQRLEGQSGPSSLPSEVLSSKASKFSDQHARHALRESSFLSAFSALMRLYADDATRSQAQKIFDLLREIRMIDIGDDPGNFASEMPPFASPAEGETPEERKRSMLGSFLSHHGGMSDFMQKRQEAWDKQIERSDALLREALAEARTLL